MTWLLCKVCELLAIGYSVRLSLKMLKRLVISDNSNSNISSTTDITSNNTTEPNSNTKSYETDAKEVLMFWSIYGIYSIWERHFEFIIRWFPGYYYAKSFFIVCITFHKLKLTHIVFYQFLIPTLELMNKYMNMSDTTSAIHFILTIPLHMLLLVLPNIMDNNTITSDKDGIIVRKGVRDVSLNKSDMNVMLDSHDDDADVISSFDIDTDGMDVEQQQQHVSTPTSPSKRINLIYDDAIADEEDIIVVQMKESSRRLSSLLPPILRKSNLVSTSPSSSASAAGADSAIKVLSSPFQSVMKFAKKLSPIRNVGSSSKENAITPTGMHGSINEETIFQSPPAKNPRHSLLQSARSALSGSAMRSSLFDIYNPPINSILRDKRRQTLILQQLQGTAHALPTSSSHNTPTQYNISRISPTSTPRDSLSTSPDCISSRNRGSCDDAVDDGITDYNHLSPKIKLRSRRKGK